MSGIGIGIGIGLGGRSAFTAGKFSAALSALWGANLVELLLGDDLAESPTAWPARVGGNGVMAGTGTWSRAAFAGRQSLLSTGETWKCFRATCSVAPLDVLCVAEASPTVATNKALASLVPANDLPRAPFVVLGNGTTFLGGGGWTNYLDGTASSNVGTGLNVYEASIAANTWTDLQVGAWGEFAEQAGAGYCWATRIAMVRALSIVPTTEQRATELALISKYYPGVV